MYCDVRFAMLAAERAFFIVHKHKYIYEDLLLNIEIYFCIFWNNAIKQGI